MSVNLYRDLRAAMAEVARLRDGVERVILSALDAADLVTGNRPFDKGYTCAVRADVEELRALLRNVE